MVSIESLRKAFNGSQNAVAVVRVKRDSSSSAPTYVEPGSSLFGSTHGSAPMNVHLSMNRRSTGTNTMLGGGNMVFGGGSAGSQGGIPAASGPSAGGSFRSSTGKDAGWDDAMSETREEEEELKGRPAATCSLDPVYLNKAVLRMLDIRTMQVGLAPRQGVQHVTACPSSLRTCLRPAQKLLLGGAQQHANLRLMAM